MKKLIVSISLVLVLTGLGLASTPIMHIDRAEAGFCDTASKIGWANTPIHNLIWSFCAWELMTYPDPWGDPDDWAH